MQVLAPGKPATATHAPAPSTAPAPVVSRTRTGLSLTVAQVVAIDRCARATKVDLDHEMSREQRMDLERLRAARDREREAMVRRTALGLARSGLPLAEVVPVRAVVAHRHEWFRDKVCAGLAQAGIDVLEVLEDGADASGTSLAEQPDLVLLEDRLPSFTGLDVVKRLNLMAQDSVLCLQVSDPGLIGEAMDAGASLVFTRRIPPADVVREMVRAVSGDGPVRRPRG